MPAPPLTHHDILALVEPFARSGRHVDLAASNRVERRLVFKPVEFASEPAASGPLQETLQLEARDDGSFRLTRTLTAGDVLQGGPQATLQALGQRPDRLLAQVNAVPAAQQFQFGAGFVIARSYELGVSTATPHADDSAPPALILRRGVVQVEGLTLTLSGLEVRGPAADIALASAPGAPLDLPDDLLAVLGWSWARLVPAEAGWKTRLRLRGNALRRSRLAERALETVAQHLAQVLAEAPSRFHERHAGARWGVVWRRAIPSLTAIALIATALLLPRLVGQENSGLMMALHYVPIAVLALSFKLQELARFEIPPWPRASTASAWQVLPVAESTTPDPRCLPTR